MRNFDEYIDASAEEMTASLAAAVRKKSVFEEDGSPYPFGRGVHECLEYVLSLADSMGFRTCNMDDRCGWCEYGEGEEMIGILTHLDVVPEGTGWTVEPFGAEIKDGRMYGRGTIDDKGGAISSLYALKAIKDSGLPLKRRIRILFGCDEERGCGDMKYYRENGGEIPVLGFTPDGNYPLINGEKGLIIEKYRCSFEPGFIRSLSGGNAENQVPDYACAVLADGTKIEATGVNAHGAMPWEGENAIGKLFLKLAELPLEGKLKKAVDFVACKIGTETRGESLGVHLHDDISGDLSFNMGTVSGDESSMTIGVNYRYPVTMHFEDCGPQVKKQFEEAGFELVSAMREERLYVPADSFLVRSLLAVYKDYTGEDAEPLSIGGGTYAKTIPNIVAFGPIFPGDEVREHKADEFILLSRLMDVAKISARAMFILAGEENV